MLKYLLILGLGAAFIRFLNNLARLGRQGSGRGRFDAEEAEYEILPDDPDPPPDPAG
jgi:hypothetical protein